MARPVVRALDYLQGKLITRTEERHTHVEWLRFLKQIDRETPKSLELHLIADNYATHKHPKVKAWLAKRPRQAWFGWLFNFAVGHDVRCEVLAHGELNDLLAQRCQIATVSKNYIFGRSNDD